MEPKITIQIESEAGHLMVMRPVMGRTDAMVREVDLATTDRPPGKLETSCRLCVLRWTCPVANSLIEMTSGANILLRTRTREEASHRFQDWTCRVRRSTRQHLSLRQRAAKEGRWKPQDMSSWPRFAWSYIGTANFREAR